jgi:hypothetical protein
MVSLFFLHSLMMLMAVYVVTISLVVMHLVQFSLQTLVYVRQLSHLCLELDDFLAHAVHLSLVLFQSYHEVLVVFARALLYLFLGKAIKPFDEGIVVNYFQPRCF